MIYLFFISGLLLKIFVLTMSWLLSNLFQWATTNRIKRNSWATRLVSTRRTRNSRPSRTGPNWALTSSELQARILHLRSKLLTTSSSSTKGTSRARGNCSRKTPKPTSMPSSMWSSASTDRPTSWSTCWPPLTLFSPKRDTSWGW